MELTFKMKKSIKSTISNNTNKHNNANITKGKNTCNCVYSKDNYTHCAKIISNAHNESITNIIQLKNGNIASSSGSIFRNNPDEDSLEINHPISIRIWEYPNMKIIKELIGHRRMINCIIELSDGNLASCAYDKHILIYDLSSNSHLPIIRLKCQSLMIYSIIELNNTTIAASEGNSISIWNITTQEKVSVFKLGRIFTHFIYIPKENTIVSGTFDGNVLFLSVSLSSSPPALTLFTKYRYHKEKITYVTELSKRRIASCSSDCTISIITQWPTKDSDDMDFECDNAVIILQLPTECKILIEISEYIIAVGDYDGNIIFWDIITRNCCSTIFAHSRSIASLIMTHDNRIISGSMENDIKIWY